MATLEERLSTIQVSDPITDEQISLTIPYIAIWTADNTQFEVFRSRVKSEVNRMFSDGEVTRPQFNQLIQDVYKVFGDLQSAINSREYMNSEGESPNTTARKHIRKLVEQVRPSRFRIGVIDLGEHLAGEPQVVEVMNNYDVRRIGSLRSDTDTVFVGNKGRTEIRLELDFPNTGAMTSVLRPLVAQFRVAPVLSVESDLLVDIFFNKFSTRDSLDAILRAYENRALSGDVSDEMEALGEEAFTDFTTLKQKISEGDDITLHLAVKARVAHEKKYAKGDRLANIKPGKEAGTTIRDVAHYGIRMGVSLSNFTLATLPESNNAVRVTLTLVRIYDRAFNRSELTYRDEVGNPTFDPFHCVYLKRFFDRVYLQGPPPEEADFLGQSGATVTKNYMREDIEEDALVNCPLQFHYQAYQAFEESFKHLNLEDTATVIQGIQVNWTNKLAFIPIQGQHDPAVQHMGTSNMTARLQLATTDRDVVFRLHEMKDELEEIHRRESGYDRDQRIYVKNGLLNMIGGYSFVIGTMSTTTDPKSPNLTYITLTLVESKYGVKERETATYWRESINLEYVKAFWEALYEPFNRALHKVSALTQEEQTALRIVFGAPHEDDEFLTAKGVLSTRVFIASLTRWVAEKHRGRTTASEANTAELYNADFIPWVGEYDFDGRHAIRKWLADSKESFQRWFYDRKGRLPAGETRGPDSRGYRDIISIFEPLEWTLSGIQVSRVQSMVDAIHESARWSMERGTEIMPGDELDEDPPRGIGVGDNKERYNAVSPLYRFLIGLGDPVLDRRFWTIIGETIAHRYRDRSQSRPAWLTRDLDAAYTAMRAAITVGLADRLPGFDQSQFIDRRQHVNLDPDNREGSLRAHSNYPDLYLPTYEEMFSDGNGKLLKVQVPNPDPGEYSGIEYHERDLWTVFAPRWADLGVIPPFSARVAFKTIQEAGQQLARKPKDVVEPSFFYYPYSMKDAAEKGFYDFEEAYEDLYADALHSENVIRLQANPPGNSTNEGFAWLFQRLVEAGRGIRRGEGPVEIPWEVADDSKLGGLDAQQKALMAAKLAKGEIPSITFVDHEGRELYVRLALDPGGDGKPARTMGFKVRHFPAGPKFIRNPITDPQFPFDHGAQLPAVRTAIAQMPDNLMSMIRSYPAYRVYFIEEDREQLLYIDDFYGINCVSSVEIRDSKRDASLAIIRITNVSGNFESDTFLNHEEQAKLGIGPDEEGEPIFKTFKFRSGTLVQIRIGYTARPDDLPIIFTGKIVEIKQGPVIQLVCQGHRAELLNELEYQRSTVNPLQVLEECFEKLKPPHLGRRMALGEYSQETIKYHLGDKSIREVEWWDEFFKQEFNSYLRNVYLHSNATREVSAWKKLAQLEVGPAIGAAFKRFRHTSVVNWFSPDWTFDNWIIPLQPFWDAIREIVRHMPGHIAQVVPFEQDATLFIGTPNQPYLAYVPEFSESQAFQKLNRMVRVAALETGPARRLTEFIRSDRHTNVYYWHNEDLQEDGRQLSLPNPYVANIGIDGYRAGPHQGLYWGLNKREDFNRMPFDFSTAYARTVDESLNTPTNPFDDLPGWLFFKGSHKHRARFNIYLYDFTQDWDYLQDHDPDLLRYAVSHVMLFDPTLVPWPGALEGVWGSMFRSLMAPILDDDLDLTPKAVDWRSMYIESSASPLLDDEAMDQVLLRESHVWSLDTDGPDVKGMRGIIEELRRGGRIEESHADLLLEQIQEYDDRDYPAVQWLKKELIAIDPTLALAGRQEIPAFNPFDPEAVHVIPGEKHKHVTSRASMLRLFIHYLRVYIEEDDKNAKRQKPELQEYLRKRFRDTRSFMLPPGWKNFREYHLVTSRSDIISNDITATMQEMANTVVIRRPYDKIEFKETQTLSIEPEDNQSDSPTNEKAVAFHSNQEWSSYPEEEGIPFHGSIPREYRKLAVRVEPNAVSNDQAARCCISGLAEMVRPMYRGHLMIVGRHVKPYDVILLRDEHNQMIGPFEVDEVVHHFSDKTGWVTTITPHAFCTPQDAPSRVQLSGVEKYFSAAVDWWSEHWIEVEVGLFIIGAIFGGGVGGGAAAWAGRGLRVAANKVAQGFLKRGALAATRGAYTGVGRKTVERAVAEACIASLRNLQGRRTLGAAAGAISARNTSVARNVTRYLLGPVRNWARVGNLIGGPLSTIMGPVWGSSHFLRMRIGKFQAPIDISLLFVKGRPYTAGLEYRDQDVYTFWDQARGWLNDIGTMFDELPATSPVDEAIHQWMNSS